MKINTTHTGGIWGVFSKGANYVPFLPSLEVETVVPILLERNSDDVQL